MDSLSNTTRRVVCGRLAHGFEAWAVAHSVRLPAGPPHTQTGRGAQGCFWGGGEGQGVHPPPHPHPPPPPVVLSF